MSCKLSAFDSIRALLHSIGFRPLESMKFAKSLRWSKNQIAAIRSFLSKLLDGALLTHVENAILRLLKSNDITGDSVLDLLVLIWNNTKYNIAVASNRLLAALAQIEEEPIVFLSIQTRVHSTRNELVAAAS